MCTSLSSPSHPLSLTPSPPHRPENTHKGAAAAQQADLNLLYWSSEGGRMWESGRVCESVEVVWEGVRGVGKYLWLLPRPLQRRWWRRWRCVENVRWYLRRTLMETRMIGSLVLPIGSISLRYIPAILCTLDNLHPSILLSNPPPPHPHGGVPSHVYGAFSFLPSRHTIATAGSLKTLRTKPEEQPTEAR